MSIRLLVNVWFVYCRYAIPDNSYSVPANVGVDELNRLVISQLSSSGHLFSKSDCMASILVYLIMLVSVIMVLKFSFLAGLSRFLKRNLVSDLV